MKILVTGGYGFIGSFIAERFFKENHSIYIIDNLSSGKKENIYFNHRSFIGNIEDDTCEAFFRTHSFDVVIHCAAQTYVQQSIENPVLDSETNILGLINMLNLSRKYGVKKFVFCSSAAIYGDTNSLPIAEDTPAHPISPYGLNKLVGEMYCRKWEELYGLSSLIFRFSNVYGPKQHVSKESGVIAKFTACLLKDNPLVIYGDGNQTRDFIYVGDIADAIYRSVVSDLSGTYNLSSNTEISVNQLITELRVFRPVSQTVYADQPHGDITRSRLDNTKIKTKLDWVPKFSLHEGLEKVIHYYEQEESQESASDTEVKSVSKSLWKHPLFSLLENAVLFILFYAVSSFLTPIVDTVDVWLIYILLAALLFGKTQSVVASILALSVHMYDMTLSGRDWMSLFIDNSLLATFTIYLLVGLIISYVVDRRKIELQFTKDELVSSQSKYAFLTKVYDDTLQVKNQLQEQILRTEDGIGKIYFATRELDSLEPEALFSGAIKVLEQTLKAKRFSIYLVDSYGYMRLAAKSNDASFQPASSLKVQEGSMIENCIASQSIKYNTSLQPNEPIFVSPIIQNQQTIALIACYDAEFEQLTLSYQNLIDVVSRLITASLSRAHDYIEEINTKRYIKDTNALTSFYFLRMLEQKRKAMRELHIPYVRLHVLTEDITTELLQAIGNTLRTNDYFGYDENGALSILLSNVQQEDAKLVIERLRVKSIIAVLDEKELPHVG
ncbi:nucleoside-diphosphate-sugar epimerase [Bacillus ectoiniformans]|uniref:NAD-dependent epimerase/dehydratase family protein n=1 Tax=Bacillus ectoiniformans TaxID=1494429 RepID=UPI00195CBF50|nr:NAD-dependent epimerase/dehydratase family protein [Bacillus ectoiniformans]MBM7649087.1 nucleoside-diphosphate-sugar epimerase [Bacillus ectoiniformans]